MSDKEKIRGHIRGQYAKAARREVTSCCSGECGCNGTAADVAAVSKKLGYSEQDFFDAPYESNMGLGCGNPIAIALLKEGETVLDLGSGGGFDCFIARKKVGETGRIIGVDMTPDMLTLARKNAENSGYKNVEFRLGEIEHLPVADGSVDVIISNCVINLSLDKAQVFSETYRVLKKGGRLSISDVVAVAEIPEEFRKDFGMISGCMGGAEHIDKLKKMLSLAGFIDIKVTLKDNSGDIIASWAPDTSIENYVASAVIEARKPACCCCGGKC
ncbi:MAG: arsenite methyltransferase [Firmicutes bacterium]|nr:arsenite methyltransferase [Bacillota bacterium]